MMVGQLLVVSYADSKQVEIHKVSKDPYQAIESQNSAELELQCDGISEGYPTDEHFLVRCQG
jgi:hypothetical protein